MVPSPAAASGGLVPPSPPAREDPRKQLYPPHATKSSLRGHSLNLAQNVRRIKANSLGEREEFDHVDAALCQPRSAQSSIGAGAQSTRQFLLA